MKSFPLVITFCLSLFSHFSQSQSIVNLTYECLPDYDKQYGDINAQRVNKDTVRISMKSYGPCDVDFNISAEIVSEVYGGITLKDKNIPKASGAKIDCACMYQIDFLIVDIGPVGKGWAVNNETMSTEAWEEWYWEHKE